MNVPASFMQFIEGAETDDDDWLVPMAVVRCLVPFLAIRTYGKGQVGVESLDSGGGLVLDDIAHLLRPPPHQSFVPHLVALLAQGSSTGRRSGL